MRSALPPFLFPSSESGSAMRALFVLPVAALALAACSPADVEVDGTAVPATRHIESSTVAPPPPVEPARIDPYVTTVDVVDEVIREVAADEGIILPAGMGSQYADIICEGLSDGLSPMALVRIAVAELTQWDSGQHSFLVGASIGAKCPEFSYLVGGA